MSVNWQVLRNAPRPEFHVSKYQDVSFLNNLKLRCSNDTYRQLVFNTRDYSFCSQIFKIIPAAEKTYTRFNLFFLHSGLLAKCIRNINRREYNFFSKEIDLFNKHLGVFMFDVISI